MACRWTWPWCECGQRFQDGADLGESFFPPPSANPPSREVFLHLILRVSLATENKIRDCLAAIRNAPLLVYQHFTGDSSSLEYHWDPDKWNPCHEIQETMVSSWGRYFRTNYCYCETLESYP